jgi:CDP-diacylglycerol---serine O-phosphatidyltransferase
VVFYLAMIQTNPEIYLNFAFLLDTTQPEMNMIPNFITSLNLASGFAAVIFAATGDIYTASWMIAAAMIFDFFDGFSARLLKAYSAIGKELDSLADMVSFGVAPGFIMYILLISSFSAGITPALGKGSVNNILLIAVSALMPVCAALRLAKFNLDETQTKSFKGLPTPANALAVISIVLARHISGSAAVIAFSGSSVLLILFTIILSVLMVTRLPLLSLKASDLKFKGNESRYIMIGLIAVAFIFGGFAAAPLIIPIYILASLTEKLF